MFINGLPENITSGIKLFADDCVLYRPIINNYSSSPNGLYIDYYMLRAWYRFYSRDFNTISRTSDIIRLFTYNNLFITYYKLKEVKASERFDKTGKQFSSRQSNSSRQNWRRASAKRATRLVQPNYSNLFDSTIQTREVIWHHLTQWNDIISLHGYHFYSRLYHTDKHTQYVIKPNIN